MSAFTLTELEVACDVTVPKVAALSERAHLTGDGLIVVEDRGPALTGAAARMKAGGPVTFVGINRFDHALYRVRSG